MLTTSIVLSGNFKAGPEGLSDVSEVEIKPCSGQVQQCEVFVVEKRLFYSDF